MPRLPRHGTQGLQHSLPHLARRKLARFLFALPLVTLIVGCGARAPDEQALRTRIAAMRDALAEGRAADFMAPIAEDFAGPEADFDRRRAGLLLRVHLQRYRGIRADLGPVEVTLHGARAEARFLAVLRAGEGLLPEEAGAWRVETGWRREGGEWKLIAARWQRAFGG